MNDPRPRPALDLAELHEKLAREAGLQRSAVKCLRCGAVRVIAGADALRSGWPTCCSETMHLQVHFYFT